MRNFKKIGYVKVFQLCAKKIFLISFLLSLFLNAFGQETFHLPFVKGEKICFVGNSITHAGGYHHNILLYHITRFPEESITFYNCGVGGDVAGKVLQRLDDDVLDKQPTYITLMLGMNDVNRSLYTAKPVINIDTLNLRKEAINIYKKKMENIVEIFLSHDIPVILQKPTIYDQTALIATPNHYGVNDALKTCADYIDTLASKHNIPVIDYWTILGDINKKVQENDSSATIIGTDRVHPGAAGHFIMAYQFLKTINSPKYVSKIVIGKDAAKSLNCEINSLLKQAGNYTFTVKEYALPFPLKENQKQALNYVDFMGDMNTQLLQIRGIDKGMYELIIDGDAIAEISSEQFEKGVNLAQYENTPQYRQAIKVREILEELWLKELAIRDMKFIEYNPLYITCSFKDDLDKLKSYFMEKYNDTSYRGYYEYVLNRYLENKPKQNELAKIAENLRQEVYRYAQPVEHNFVIRKK